MENLFQRPFSRFVNQDSGSDLGLRNLFGGYEQREQVDPLKVS